MTRDYSILVDNWADEKWVMTGRDAMLSVLKDENSIQYKQLVKESGESNIKELICRKADEYLPICCYAYPLDKYPGREKVIRICEETNCTVVKAKSTAQYFLVIRDGGVHLSHDVAMAYIIAQGYIPAAVAMKVWNTIRFGDRGDTKCATVMKHCRHSLLENIAACKKRANEISLSLNPRYIRDVHLESLKIKTKSKSRVDFAPDGTHYKTMKKGSIEDTWDYFMHDTDMRVQLMLNPSARYRLVAGKKVIGVLAYDGKEKEFQFLTDYETDKEVIG